MLVRICEVKIVKYGSKLIRPLLLAIGILLFANVCAPPAAEALLIGTKQEIELGKGVAADLERDVSHAGAPTAHPTQR